LAQQTGNTPGVSQVRKVATKPGFVANLEQEVTSDLGVFVRYSIADGSKEAYEFTDISKSLSGGLSLKGTGWGRADDVVGAAIAINRISGTAQQYFAMGGLGLLIGDGQLNYAPEQIFEAYYSLHPSTQSRRHWISSMPSIRHTTRIAARYPLSDCACTPSSSALSRRENHKRKLDIPQLISYWERSYFRPSLFI
jgi:hypothetical protein